MLQAQNLTYKNLPKNLAVTLNYWQQIDGFLAYNEKLPRTCKIKNTIKKRIIICPVWVKIIINKKQLLSWQEEQKKNGFINLYLPKIGIMHEKVKIAKVKKVIQQASTDKNQHLATVVYMRYAHVLIYKIKDVDTGKMSEITVTPEHKFHEATYNKFMAIRKLGPDSTITNAPNHHLKIICDNNKQNNCGIAPLNSLQKVYNMEVDKAHNYFVGNIKALVHNGCYDYYYKCRKCDEAHREKFLFSHTCTITKKHIIRKVYQCDMCSMSSISPRDLRRHKIIHKNESGKYSCRLCGVKIETVRGLTNHKKMHSNNKYKIFCCECDKFVFLKDTLTNNHEHEQPIYTLKIIMDKSIYVDFMSLLCKRPPP